MWMRAIHQSCLQSAADMGRGLPIQGIVLGYVAVTQSSAEDTVCGSNRCCLGGDCLFGKVGSVIGGFCRRHASLQAKRVQQSFPTSFQGMGSESIRFKLRRSCLDSVWPLCKAV